MATYTPPKDYSLPTSLTAPKVGANATAAISTDTANKLAQLYGFKTGSTNFIGSEAEIAGRNLVVDAEMNRVFNINNPYQVGVEQFDTNKTAAQLKRTAQFASTTFVGADSRAATVTPYSDIRGS